MASTSRSSSSPQRASEAETLMLLHPPKKWTAKHLEVARVQVVHDVPPSEIVEDKFIPKDGDEEFENLAEMFCKPSREQLEGTVYLETRRTRQETNPLGMVFLKLVGVATSEAKEARTVSCLFLEEFVQETIKATEAGHRLIDMPFANISFNVPKLLSVGKLRRNPSVIVRCEAGVSHWSIPLAILSVVISNSSTTTGVNLSDTSAEIARYVAPQMLVQALITYDHNSCLKQYTGFVISLHRTAIRVSRAWMSRDYMKSLWEGQPVNENMRLYRSREFELLDREDRRKFMRFIVGLFRYLAQSEESTINAEKVQVTLH